MNAYLFFNHNGNGFARTIEVTNDVVFDVLQEINEWCDKFGYRDVVHAAQDGWEFVVNDTDVTNILASMSLV